MFLKIETEYNTNGMVNWNSIYLVKYDYLEQWITIRSAHNIERMYTITHTYMMSMFCLVFEKHDICMVRSFGQRERKKKSIENSSISKNPTEEKKLAIISKTNMVIARITRICVNRWRWSNCVCVWLDIEGIQWEFRNTKISYICVLNKKKKRDCQRYDMLPH